MLLFPRSPEDIVWCVVCGCCRFFVAKDLLSGKTQTTCREDKQRRENIFHIIFDKQGWIFTRTFHVIFSLHAQNVKKEMA